LILISGSVGEDAALEAMKLGVADYFLKDRIGLLGKSVEVLLEQRNLREQQKQSQEALQRQLQELQRWQEAMLGREGRILELKREVNELLAQLKQPARYFDPENA
jgi:DNA-binding NtrC family response regulator